MRRARWVALSMAAVALAVAPLGAQTPEYRAPRAADGTPDLNGIWQAMNTAHWDVEPHGAGPSVVRELGALSAVPGGLGVVDGDAIPYRSEALARRDENRAHRLERDPAIKCYLPGVPRGMYMPFPVQIIQSQEHIMILHEFAGAVRTVYMKDQVPAPADSWMGWSNGRWDGDTLEIDTTGFNGQTWFDQSGNFHSEALHVVERITRRSAETLLYEVTIEDPNVFTQPWTMSMPLYRRVEDNAQLLEFRCVEFVEDLIYGHLRKEPRPER
ncbi:MAG: hypothetical protein QF681_01665 [Vicinamibacterales bacterium]|jgi:hypothetical protein|nr:hypothetical protein [Vicinamibacterales bacterium]